MFSGSTHDSVDPSRCHYLQIHLKACQIWDDERSVFSFLQEMIGNNVRSIKVRRDDTLSFSSNQHPFISPENEASQQICLLRVNNDIDCSTSVYSDLYIEKNRGGEKLREDRESFPRA